MTTMVRLLERDGLVVSDRTSRMHGHVYLTARARRFRPVAEEVLARLDDLVPEALGARRSLELATDLEEVSAL